MKKLLIVPLIFFLSLALFLKNTDKVEAQATDRFASEFANLPCAPAGNADLTINGGPSGMPISIGTSSGFAGTITSLKINGQETVFSDFGAGVLLQYSFEITPSREGENGESNNPTEAGSQGDTTISKFIEGCASGNTLYTKSQMALWYPRDGERWSPYILSKKVQIGYLGIPNLVRFLAVVHAPVASYPWLVEAPGGHMLGRFVNNLQIFDGTTKTIRPVKDSEWGTWPQTVFDHTLYVYPPNLIVSSDGQYSLTPYMPFPYFYFFLHYWPDPQMSKWGQYTTVEDAQPGDYYFESYLLISPDSSANGEILQMLDTVSPTPSKPQILYPVNGSQVSSASPVTIDWTDSTVPSNAPVSYRYEAFADSNYTQRLAQSPWLSASQLTGSGVPGTTYYIRIEASTGSLSSSFSNGPGNPYKITFTGSGDTASPPSTPQITSPANGGEVSAAVPATIDWTDSTTPSNMPVSYRYESFTDSAYTQMAGQADMLSTSQFTGSGVPGTTYYIRVLATAGGLTSAYSNGPENPYKITFVGLRGDLNADGVVNNSDYQLLLGNFGKTGTEINGDIDGNGKVDIFDFNILVENFSKPQSPLHPEPAIQQ